MLIWIPLLPFIGFLINASLGRRLKPAVSGGVAVAAMLGAFGISVASAVQLLALDPEVRAISQPVFQWITSGDLDVGFTLRLDPLSMLMILVVTGIGSLIHIYSTAYMHDERDSEFARYFSYLNLFAAFMLVLVLGANFLVMFVGWEGVGLCSYLLIGFWYEKKSASDAGKKAFIVNRIGDAGFILGVLLLFGRFGTLDFQEIAHAVARLSPDTTFGMLSLATLLLFVGATGKSAQIPLYVWLPDAMEGPTPVSALIHAATMVTAGVYMIGRNAVLFSHAPQTLTIVAVVGVATAFVAGTIGLVQNDIKRVLAYSTVSQLGYMFLAMGVGAYGAGIFHLYTHAFFKALLFLGSGAVIHALGGQQDLRYMGGLKKDLPITYWTFLIGAIAIAGVPGLAGFFSKDEILFQTYSSGHTFLWIVGLLTSLLTAIYMFRLVFLAFHGERRAAASEPPAHAHAATGHDDTHGGPGGVHQTHGGHGLHDAPAPMALALVVLAIGSIVAGYVGFPRALGGSAQLERFLEPSWAGLKPAPTGVGDEPVAGRDLEPNVGAGREPGSNVGAGRESGSDVGAGLRPALEHEDVSVERTLMGVSSLIAVAGIGIAGFLFLAKPGAANALAERFGGLRTLLLNKYYVDEVYDAAIVQPIRLMSEEGLWKAVDARGIDGAVNGAAQTVGGLSTLMRRLQSGSVRAYAASLICGVVLVLGYFLWR
jgi:NADH-quinone oxidoreductase subunit L